MLDDVGLVHMNGRLYDPSLGRMCGADPYVQTPENLQNYNRYSYVLNNPLSQIDPSGHFIIGLIVALGAAIIGIIGGIIATVVAFVAYLAALAAQFVLMVIGAKTAAVGMGAMGASLKAAAIAGVKAVTGFVTGSAFGMGNTLLGKMIGGAALGAIYSGGQTAINGGSFSDVLKSAAIGAATGAVGAMVGGALAGIPDAVSGALTPVGAAGPSAAAVVAGKVVHSAAHGVAGGLMSMAMGGTFKDGFIGSAIGAGVSHITGALPFMEDLQGPGVMKVVGRTAIAAISGGASSALAGGKFADGAFSAAFLHLFNDEMHQFGKRSYVMNHKNFVAYASDGTAYTFASLDDFVSFLTNGVYVANPLDNYTGQCATGGQYLCGAQVDREFRDVASTRYWREGASLDSHEPQIGTLVATGWEGGRYMSRHPEAYKDPNNLALYQKPVNHVGVYMGKNSDGTFRLLN